MKSTHTTTAALALALSVFLAHGAAAQNDTRSAGTPSNPSTTTQPMNETSTSNSNYGANPSSSTTSTTVTTPAGSLTATGKVVTKNADSVIVLTDAGQRVTVYTDASSVLPTATWAVGDRVTVNYTTPSTGRNHADTIVIASAPSTSYPSSTTTTTTTDMSATDTTSSTTLPKTASSLPLTLLLGSFAGAAAVGLHLARRNV